MFIADKQLTLSKSVPAIESCDSKKVLTVEYSLLALNKSLSLKVFLIFLLAGEPEYNILLFYMIK